MHLISILILVSCAASSSALFSHLKDAKRFFFGPLLGYDTATNNIIPEPKKDHLSVENKDCVKKDCIVEEETILEDICKNVTRVTCEIKPVEECHETLISVCKDVIEEVCEEKEEKVCKNVSKELCNKGRCETVLIPKCSLERCTICHNNTKEVCHEEPREKCNSVDKEVCCDSTKLECEEIEKLVPTGRECCTVITPKITKRCELIQKPVDEEVCKTELKCETIMERKCTTQTDESGVETKECCEEPKEVCKTCEVCKMVTKFIEEELCQDIKTYESSVV